MSRKLILFELNEVPFRILDEYRRWRPESHLASIFPVCRRHVTLTQDEGGLSPWITWPSLHRGVSNRQHGISDFGQDLRQANADFPPVWEILRSHGIKTGVCGSLHSYRPADFSGYEFFLPDAFSKGPECFPPALEAFQRINLKMSQASARNVSTRIPVADALRLALLARQLGVRAATFGDIALQLVKERITPARRVRRRTYQSVLTFDIFMDQLGKTRPAFATVFSNHVASAMHRYWPAAFPGDYSKMGFDRDWIDTYSGEIRFAMDKADAFLGRLLAFVDRKPEYMIWIASSMGQAAAEAVEVKTSLYITEPRRFMDAMGVHRNDWTPVPAMLPQFNVKVSGESVPLMRKCLAEIEVNGEKVPFVEGDDGFFSVRFGHQNLDPATLVVRRGGTPVNLHELGLGNVAIQDASGASAYHIPEGCFVCYDPLDRTPKETAAPISALDLAPMILRNFGLPVPAYMEGVAAPGLP